MPTTLATFGPEPRRLTAGRLAVRVFGRPWHVRGQRFNPLHAGLLTEVLRADGFAAWIAAEDLIGGEQRKVAIRRVIGTSRAVVVCLSAESARGRDAANWQIKIALEVADEFGEDDIFVIPVRFDECELPGRLSELTPVDLFQQNGYTRLVRAIRTSADR